MLFVFQLYFCLYMALIFLAPLVTAVPKQRPFKVQLHPPVPSPSLQKLEGLLILNFPLGSLPHKSSSRGYASYIAYEHMHRDRQYPGELMKKLDKKLSRRHNSILLSYPND